MAKKIQTGSGGNKLRANQQAAGIPESRPFVAGDENRTESSVDKILKCHIDGILVKDLNLEPQVLAALDYFGTDEGIKERENHPMARERSGVSLGKEPTFDKVLEHKRDDVKRRDIALAEAADPLREVADQYAKPGMHERYLSARKIQENGSTGGYEIVKDANGDPVKVRGMLLGHIPQEVADARQKHYESIGNDRLKQVTQQFREEGGKQAVVD